METLGQWKAVGIDVSKATLDVAYEEQYWSARNDAEGIMELVDRIQAIGPEVVVLESTGGLEMPVVVELHMAGLPVAVVNPSRVRQFAKSINVWGKTDRIDAFLLARFGGMTHPELYLMPTEEEKALAELVTRRRQLLEMRTMEKNRSKTAPVSIESSIQWMIEVITDQVKEINQKIVDLIQTIPVFRQKDKILRSIPGVGFIVSATLLAELPELGRLTNKQIASLAGLAPFNNDSGSHRGKRRIRGGRTALRSVLFMAAMTAIRNNPLISSFYQRLLTKGKVKMVALVACMRKLLVIMNAMVRDSVLWRPLPLDV